MPPRKRTADARAAVVSLTDDDRPLLQAILGHLNFSGGRTDPKFLANLNAIWPKLPPQAERYVTLRRVLLEELDRVQGTSAVFSNVEQARAVIEITLPGLLDAYQQFHRDLLFHLKPIDYDNPFFAGRLFEAVLTQGSPWDDRERILEGALRQLNDYIGYRPVAVLENGRLMQPYPHEKFAPIPLYVAGAGVAQGLYSDLIERTLTFLREAPQDLLQEAHLDPDQIAEIALDVRAHDHLHPVNKRTNYMFGEWDPHSIDNKGQYRRFVLRKVVLDAMADWARVTHHKQNAEERLFDAAAALCGTMLMAASVSGAGPGTHDSTTSLTNLLPIIARRRDEFYARLTAQADGPRARRLKKIEKETRQPFGHVRQHLNMHLAGFGARQVQHRELALLFARIGDLDASRRHANSIPAASLRIECEVLCELNLARRRLREGEMTQAAERLVAVEDLIQRGIECGAIVDPWNVLGFGGHYPLFAAREDAIPDNRIESLMDLMEETFNVYGDVLIAAASHGEQALQQQVSDRFQKLAEWWDRFATDVIEDIPEVIGQESWESATHVARILSEWLKGGRASGDVSFWRQHIDRFQSAHAYGPVVNVLLDQKDYVASFGLMMQWLGQAEEVGLEGPQHSLLGQLIRWMKGISRDTSTEATEVDRATTIRRLFDFLEANAGIAWKVPTLEGTLSGTPRPIDPDWMGDGLPDEEPEAEENPFQAAFEGVTFKDSADDGNWGDTLDEQGPMAGSEFEMLNREMEPRLKFLNAVGQLWQMAAAALVSSAARVSGQDGPAIVDPSLHPSIDGWRRQCRQWESELLQLMNSLWTHAVSGPSGDHNDNIEFDLQLQVKYYLLNQIVVALISLKNAERMLSGCLPSTSTAATPREEDLEENLSAVYGAVIRRDADEVARRLPLMLRQLQKHPLLYVPFDHGGTPDQILRAQTMQSVARFLLKELPRLGMLRSTWHLLNTVFKMERRWRPEGQAITEFDRLFDIALRNSLQTLNHSFSSWPDSSRSADDLLNALGELLEPYQQLWMKHSRTMRLSSVDGVRMEEDWRQLYDFIQTYGGDLFHASQLTLGHVRAILHNGVRWYLDYLRREQDPLYPIQLIEDIDEGQIDPDDAEWCLETLYSIVVDKFDRFLEYNTTTTQSDYGQMFYTLLDFLRVEARYDREAWNLMPLVAVHDVLCRSGQVDAAALWAGMFEVQTAELADHHLSDLDELERRHGMRLPAITDHLNQRLYKSLNVNEMVALVRPAVQEMQAGAESHPAADRLAVQVDMYLEDSWGSGIDIPVWVRALDREAMEALIPDEGGRPGAEADIQLPVTTITHREFRQQISVWRNSLGGPSLRRPNHPPANPPGGKIPPSAKRPRGRKRK